MNSSSRDKTICYDRVFIERLLDKLDDLLREAYYSTPPNISSKSLVKKARDVIRSLLEELYRNP
jgi:hypothetical protein